MNSAAVIIVLLQLFCLGHARAQQNVTGTWRGEFEGQVIEVSIDQKGSLLCGFTHDYVIDEPESNCTAAYQGSYNAAQGLYILNGNRFIQNSGAHILMYIVLKPGLISGKRYLVGKIFTGSVISRMMGMGGTDILLERISTRPTKLANGEPNCFPKPNAVPKPRPVPPRTKPTTPNPEPSRPKPQQPISVTPKPLPVKPKPTVPQPEKPVPMPAEPKPTAPHKPDAALLKDMNSRKQSEISRLQVSVNKIHLKVYDNGVVDNDTVSIFYNGKLLLSHQRLSETPIEINLELDKDASEHSITMYAENLGGIPPNTALIVITAGDKRYELRSKASLQENAVLIFEFRPK